MLPNFLRDRLFLTLLDKMSVKEQYVRITVLNWYEEPVQEVTGTIISGSLNLDGKSTMRRSGSLSILADEKENLLLNVLHLFSINKKCKIEMGLVNEVPNYTFSVMENDISVDKTINYQELYGDIVWFPLGVYVMFNPSVGHSLTGITISMNLKDKMCLLNGEIAGQIHSGVDFSTQGEDWDKDNDVETNPVLMVNIIRELVNHWGNEAYSRIFISEVPNQIRAVVLWSGEDKKYLINLPNSYELFDSWIEAKLAADKYSIGLKVRFEKSSDYRKWLASFIDKLKEYNEDGELNNTSNLNLAVQMTGKTLNENDNTIIDNLANGFIYPYEPGSDIGYRYCDFIWPDKNPLECNPGETVTSVLDKIISKIGNYEYFYDVEGNFIFQEKKNNLNMSNEAFWEKELKVSGNVAPEDTTGRIYPTNVPTYNLSLPWDAYDADYRRLTKSVYNFDDNKYVTAFNNSLNYNNIKNDFLVWGHRSDGTTVCRFHLAIDKIPECQVHRVVEYVDDNDIVRAVAYVNRDELGLDVDEQGNPIDLNDAKIYNLEYLKKVMDAYPTIKKAWKDNKILHYGTRLATDWREELYYQALEAAKTGIDTDTDINNNYVYYYAELIEEFPKLYDLRPILQAKLGVQEQESYVEDLFNTVGEQIVYDKGEDDVWYGRDKALKFKDKTGKITCSHARGWKPEVFEHPENINYFLDFIDEDSELGQFCVRNIGRRSLIMGDSNSGANCVFEPAIPDVIYFHEGDAESIRNYKNIDSYPLFWCNIPDDTIWENFVTGGKLNSCYEVIKDLLYQYTHYNNTITITSLPIYYLEPGNRITVLNKANGIYGDYIIQSISLPLDINSTMNINASKALQRI